MKRSLLMLLLLMLLTACARPQGAATDIAPTPTLPQPVVNITRPPDGMEIAASFLAAWQAEDYTTMYSLLTQVARDAISEEDFAARYRDMAQNMSLQTLDYQVLSVLTNPSSAQVAYEADFNTILFQTINRKMVMNLVLENGAWRIQWEDGMILPELAGGNRLSVELKVPQRANIYDSINNALVAQSDAYALGIVPANMEDNQEGVMLSLLSELTGKPSTAIRALYDEDREAAWYIPVGEAPADRVNARFDQLSAISGLFMTQYTTRYYYSGGVAPHITGYVQPIPAESVEDYLRLGYRVDEKVGSAGLEKWGEKYLAGTRGASLYVVNPQGEITTRMAQVDALPSQAIYTTLDRDLQLGVQQALAGFRGAIVVMELDTGRILAIASSPGYDPNLFDPGNENSSYLLGELFDDDTRPLLNRATQGGYPLGSLFKIVTMAAALESGLYTAESEYECTSQFTELPGVVLNDWTFDKELPPSGLLTLPEGLMRSCNPWFYHLGLDLYRQKGATFLSDMARSFGLGASTGIEQVAEDIGAIPDPANEGDAVQAGIGQGAMLVTPLQVVDFVAAVGNGGTLYRPQVIDSIISPDGTEVYSFTPEVRGTLPVSPENLKVIQDAMLSVVENRRGTARNAFVGLDVLVYGKTGTAQNPLGDSHAWFGGYSAEGREDKSDIAVVVIAENAGEGSEVAAPIFRRVMEIYFLGKPQRLYPWEDSLYVTVTPTPRFTVTPTPPPPAPPDTPTPDFTATPIQ